MNKFKSCRTSKHLETKHQALIWTKTRTLSELSSCRIQAKSSPRLVNILVSNLAAQPNWSDAISGQNEGAGMLREIVLDTETTGLDANGGDRLIEIGCVEIVNRIPTGNEFHRFISPQTKTVHPDAFRIHGISTEFLRDKPPFADIVDELLAFLGDAPLVIHNAQFDAGFLNMELERVGRPSLGRDRLVDTLEIARRKHPAGPNSLDALCKRYGIDNSKRTKHGALMDSLLLASVYVELLGERQATLVLPVAHGNAPQRGRVGERAALSRAVPLSSILTPEVEATHSAFVETLGEKAIWKRLAVTS